MENEAAVPSGEPDEKSTESEATAATVTAADAAAAEAAERARKARARATLLHRRAGTGPADRSGRHVLPTQRRRWRLPRWRSLAAGVGVVLVCASSAASASMWWQHRIAAGQRQLASEFATAARQVAVALLTLDYTKIDERVQGILDASTGDFKANFQQNSAAIGARLGQAKVVTTVDVKDAAVRSMSANAGVVLVALRTETSESDGEPHSDSWRVAVSLTRDGGQLKLSDIQFAE